MHQDSPQTEINGVRDELSRLRGDLAEICQRLEELQRLVGDECPSIELPVRPTQTFGSEILDPSLDEPPESHRWPPATEPEMEADAVAGRCRADGLGTDQEPGSEEDPSVRDYLERLLERLGADRSSPSVAAAEPVPAVELDAADDDSRLGDKRWSPVPNDPDEPAAADIRAMRALANVAAQTVIMEFESKKHVRLALDKLLVMLVCLPCGLLLLYWYSVHRLGLAYIAASIAFFVVALWGCQAAQFLVKVVVARLSLARLWRDRDLRE